MKGPGKIYMRAFNESRSWINLCSRNSVYPWAAVPDPNPDPVPALCQDKSPDPAAFLVTLLRTFFLSHIFQNISYKTLFVYLKYFYVIFVRF